MDGENRIEIEASPLSRDHDYIRRNSAPAYWALAPHLIHQHTDASCSLATATMILNGIRALDGTARMGKFVSERSLLERMDDPHWAREIVPPEGNGVSLVEFAEKMTRVMPLFEIAGWTVMHRIVTAADPATIAGFRSELNAMERDGDRLIAGNYHLKTTYGDAWDIGHFSPIGAYDAARDRVLLLDVWKQDYEPCWVDLTRLLRGMTPVSPVSGTPRGYCVLKRG
jgi:Phytochelatin synthase